ncbi:MAG: NosD domain-containing protein [Thermoproteota archaeon]
MRILRELGFALCLLLLVSPVKTSVAEWIGASITIDENGNVISDMPDPPLRKVGTIYYLTDDIRIVTRRDGMVIKKSDIIIDGNGHIIRGSCVGDERGILLEKVRNVTLRNVKVQDFVGGIFFYFSSNNHIVNCTFTGNVFAGITLSYSNNNSIVNCTVSNNKFGIISAYSYDNSLYYNNFISNGVHAYCIDSKNTWDNYYPSGGNYWSDYTGEDCRSGLNQDEPGADSIWDEPYVISVNNRDYYPLVTPYGTARFRVSDLSISPDTVNAGRASTISVKVKHVYGSSGSYEVKLKVNDQVVDTKKVTLGPGKSIVVNFTYTPGSEGSYIIDVNGLTGSLRASKEEPPWLLIIAVVTMTIIILLVTRRRIRRNNQYANPSVYL